MIEDYFREYKNTTTSVHKYYFLGAYITKSE